MWRRDRGTLVERVEAEEAVGVWKEYALTSERRLADAWVIIDACRGALNNGSLSELAAALRDA